MMMVSKKILVLRKYDFSAIRYIEGTRMDSDIQSSSSSSSSNHSRLSLQRRLNGSLRNDPLIIAAMEDYRQLHRSTSIK
jgi:hypothetical protein